MRIYNLIIALLFVSTVSFAQDIKTVDLEESVVNWTGYKVGGAHEGTMNFQSGELLFLNDGLTSGSFVIDVTTLNVTDLKGGGKAKLEGHLKSSDYFDVETYSTSELTFSDVTKNEDGSYSINGDLTIKGITEPVSFDFLVAEDSASAIVSINRKVYGITPGTLKDKAIKDKFDIAVTIQFAEEVVE